MSQRLEHVAYHQRELTACNEQIESEPKHAVIQRMFATHDADVFMADGIAGERGVEAFHRLLSKQEGMEGLTLAALRALAQYSLLLIDTEATLAAIPSLLPADREARRKGFAIVREVMSAAGVIGDEGERRMRRMAQPFGIDESESGLEPRN